MSIVAEIVQYLERAQAGTEVKKDDWIAVLEAVPYMNMVSDENLDEDEILWACFCKDRADYENDPPGREDVYVVFCTGNRAKITFPLGCDADDQEGTWNEVLLVMLRYINQHLHLPKPESAKSLATESSKP